MLAVSFTRLVFAGEKSGNFFGIVKSEEFFNQSYLTINYE